MAKLESDSSTRPERLARRGALLATVVMAACLGLASGARAAIINFSATIDAAQETPPSGTPANGSGTFVMDTVANTLSFNIVIAVAPASGELFSHIHGFAPPGTPAGILFNLPNGSPKVGVWNFMEAQEANIRAGLTYVNIHSNAFPGGEIRGQVVPDCSNGDIDLGEQCDDGNLVNGDCCDEFCQFEPAASACTASVCETGTCDGAGECQFSIRTGCKSALKSLLLVKNDADDDTKDKLIWKWIKGAATSLEEFGEPNGSTQFTMCIYSGGNSAVAAIPSGSSWVPRGTKGFKYKDLSASLNGVRKALLKSGVDGKAKVLVKGKGLNLPDTLPPPLQLPVLVQLVNSANGVCYESVFGEGDVKKNDEKRFKAKSTVP